MLRDMRLEERKWRMAISWGDVAQTCAAILGMCLLTRAKMMLGIAPLSAGFFAAGMLRGIHPLALLLGCGLGLLGTEIALADCAAPIACIGIWGGLYLRTWLGKFFPARGKAWLGEEGTASLWAGLGILLPGLRIADGALSESAMALCNAFIAAGTAGLFAGMLHIRWRRVCLLPGERAALIVLLCGGILGFANIWIPLADISAYCVVTVVSERGFGAVLGILLGLTRCMGGGDVSGMAAFALAGAAAGCAGNAHTWRGRAMRCCMLMGSAFLYWLYAPEYAPMPITACAASILFMLMDGAWLRKLNQWLSPTEDASVETALYGSLRRDSEQKLRAMSSAFGELAENYRETDNMPDEQALLNTMRATLCEGCMNYAQCWLGEDNHAVRMLCQLISEAAETGGLPSMRDGIPTEILRVCRRGRLIPERLEALLEDFSEHRKQALYQDTVYHMISAQFLQAKALLSGMADIQARPMRLRKKYSALAAAALDQEGISANVAAIRGTRMELSVSLKKGAWMPETEETVQDCLTEAFGKRYILDATRDTTQQERRFIHAPVLKAECGVESISANIDMPNGDSYCVHAMDAATLAVMLSDGMGSGADAARESKRALRLLRNFLSAGIERSKALDAVNDVMLARGEEMFATIDMCVLDLTAGCATFSKLAAGKSFLLREGTVRPIEGGQLPLGILERVRPQEMQMEIRPDDVLVLLTDGVEDAVGDIGTLEAILLENAHKSPQDMAEAILRSAEEHRGSRADDMTALCVSIQKQDWVEDAALELAL